MVYGEYVYQRVGNPTITSVLLILIDIFSHKTKFINNKSRTRGAGRCFVMGTNAIAQQYSSRTLYFPTLPHTTFPPRNPSHSPSAPLTPSPCPLTPPSFPTLLPYPAYPTLLLSFFSPSHPATPSLLLPTPHNALSISIPSF